MKIITNHVYPPIPDRSNDWSAVTDDYDGAEGSHSPIGRGPTEASAVRDLLDQLFPDERDSETSNDPARNEPLDEIETAGAHQDQGQTVGQEAERLVRDVLIKHGDCTSANVSLWTPIIAGFLQRQSAQPESVERVYTLADTNEEDGVEVVERCNSKLDEAWARINAQGGAKPSDWNHDYDEGVERGYWHALPTAPTEGE